ncbi:AMP-binding protein [Ectothiorhodospira sp. BSL-9]|uniref:AMP-binding protein n=1 Tax=Ectothiorhodospira sp. BSL-9 TaxID=1442136 RepID=UPI0007B435C2|nr:AMP-binding protein [Ectothiorhodospira sp. BSL-9]ANB03456.1 AMP-dependent synthetase [Ectothiorhodospira sp. BSL-9]
MTASDINALLGSRELPGAREALLEMTRDGSRSWRREELLDMAGRLSAGLTAAGLKTGDRVALMAPNSAHWVAVALGVMRAGGVLVPLDTQMPGEDLAHALNDCRPGTVLTTDKLLSRLPKHIEADVWLLDNDTADERSWRNLVADSSGPARASSKDMAAIFYTSGTTGPPKGVPLSHYNLATNVQALCDQSLADDRDRVLVPLPFHHVYPFTVGILTPLTLGAPLIVPYSLVGPQIVRALRDGEATVMLGVPRLYEAIWTALEQRVTGRGRTAARLFHGMLQVSMMARRGPGWRLGRRLFAGLHRRMAPRLRLVVAGGAALDPGLGRRLQGLGWEVATGYGLSETAPILTYNPPDRVRLESAGLPLPGVELAIDGQENTGEVMARGPNVFAGYLNLPEKSREVLDDDGWFRTGDTGWIDEDGFLHLGGRTSAMILLSGGENVDPEKVEKQLEKASGIREAGVLAHDDRLAAVVVPEPQLLREVEGDELSKRLKSAMEKATQDLPTHHRPGTLKVSLDPLPRTRLGKLRRHKLEERFEALGEGAASKGEAKPMDPEAMAPEDQQLLSDPTVEQTWQYLAERFHDRRLTPDSGLYQDLGLDSLAWVDLTLTLRDRIGVETEDEAISRVQSVRDLLREVAAAGEAKEGGDERDLQTALKDPERHLDDAARRWLAPRGSVRQFIGLVLLGITRLGVRLLYRLEVQGHIPREGGPYVLAPRHLSALDPLVLTRVLTWRQLRTLYWAGWTGLMFSSRLARAFSRIVGILPIDPGRSPRRSLALAVTCLERGHSLVWFPEGRRSPDGQLQPFRPGIGSLLLARPSPVIPVHIAGTGKALPPGRRWPRPGRVRIIMGEPLDPGTLGSDPREIAQRLQDAVAALGEADNTT